MNPRIAIDARTVLQAKTGDRTYTLGLVARPGARGVALRIRRAARLRPTKHGLIAATTGEFAALCDARFARAQQSHLERAGCCRAGRGRIGPLWFTFNIWRRGRCPARSSPRFTTWCGARLPRTFPGQRSRDYEPGDARFRRGARGARSRPKAAPAKTRSRALCACHLDKISVTTIGLDDRFRAPVAPAQIAEFAPQIRFGRGALRFERRRFAAAQRISRA